MIGESDMVLRCDPCGREWVSGLELPMELKAFVERLKGVCCPGCGVNAGKSRGIRLLSGQARREAVARLASS